jgi:hypothetical protein
MSLRSILPTLSFLLFATVAASCAQITVSIAPEDKAQPAPQTGKSDLADQARQNPGIHREILQTYNFAPHTLTSRQITEHSAVLDGFWRKAKVERADYVPALRLELSNFDNPPFFLYDGSMLLLSLSDTPRDRKIALAAVSHCDLRDVQAKDYFRQIHRLATLNEDTTAATLHILQQPKFTVIVPEHALTLGQNYSAVYMLLPTDQAYWLQPVIERLKAEIDVTAQKTLLLLLWYAQTPAADEALSSVTNDASRPAVSRSYARELINRKDGMPPEYRVKASSLTEAEWRKKRQERMKAVSDEALMDLDEYTAMLIAKRQ